MKNIKAIWESFRSVILGILLSATIMFCIIYTVSSIVRRIRHRSEPVDVVAVSQNVGKEYPRKGGVRLVDLHTGRPLSPRMNWIVSPDGVDSLGVFCDLKGRRGFININTGKILGKGRYRHAWVFSEGLAAVVEPNGLLGFVNPAGEYVIPPVFEYDPDYDYVFHRNFCWILDRECHYRVIDHLGQDVLGESFSFVIDEWDNATIVYKGGLEGMLDSGMNWLYKPEYDEILVQSEKDSTVFVSKNGIKRLLTYTGEVIEPFVIDSSGPLRHEDEEDERAPLTPLRFLWYRVGDNLGVLDAKSGNVILPAVFDDVELASGDLFVCDIGRDNCEYLFYDLTGRPLGPELAKQAGHFVD